jgi:hypothetical protein
MLAVSLLGNSKLQFLLCQEANSKPASAISARRYALPYNCSYVVATRKLEMPAGCQRTSLADFSLPVTQEHAEQFS